MAKLTNLTDEEKRGEAIRDALEKRVTPEFTGSLHKLAGMTTDPEGFHNRFVILVRRYAHYKQVAHGTTKAAVKKEAVRLEKAASRLLFALEAVAPDVRKDLDSLIEYEEFKSSDWTESEETDFDTKLESNVSAIETDLAKLLRATQRLQSEPPPSWEELRGTTEVALDQFILDLDGTYETGTGVAGRTHCYYGTMEDAYVGSFFLYVKAALDHLDPGCYFSEGALGKRITRVLRPE